MEPTEVTEGRSLAERQVRFSIVIGLSNQWDALQRVMTEGGDLGLALDQLGDSILAALFHPELLPMVRAYITELEQKDKLLDVEIAEAMRKLGGITYAEFQESLRSLEE